MVCECQFTFTSKPQGECLRLPSCACTLPLLCNRVRMHAPPQQGPQQHTWAALDSSNGSSSASSVTTCTNDESTGHKFGWLPPQTLRTDGPYPALTKLSTLPARRQAAACRRV